MHVCERVRVSITSMEIRKTKSDWASGGKVTNRNRKHSKILHVPLSFCCCCAGTSSKRVHNDCKLALTRQNALTHLRIFKMHLFLCFPLCNIFLYIWWHCECMFVSCSKCVGTSTRLLCWVHRAKRNKSPKKRKDKQMCKAEHHNNNNHANDDNKRCEKIIEKFLFATFAIDDICLYNERLVHI